MSEFEGKIFYVAGVYDEEKEKTLIDLDALKLIFDNYNNKTNANQTLNRTVEASLDIETEYKQVAKNVSHSTDANLCVNAQKERNIFKRKVWALMHECFARYKQPWKNPNCVIGEAPGIDFPYDKDKIAEHYDDILALLEQIGDVTRFEDLKYLKSGEEWTISRQQIGILMTLANAAGLMDFKNPDLERYQNYNPNPEISLKRKR